MFGFLTTSSCQYARHQHMEYLDRQNVRCDNKMGAAFFNRMHLTGKGCGGWDMQYESTCITPAQWKECSAQGGNCHCPGGMVRYGDKSRYAPAKSVSTSIHCNDNVFGDPAPGVAKKCECSNGGNLGGHSCKVRYTSCQLARGRNMEYMDRESVMCPEGQLLTQMRLTSYQCGSNDMRYQYTCCTPSRGYGKCYDKRTNCNWINGQRIEYLERHDMQCGEFEAIRG